MKVLEWEHEGEIEADMETDRWAGRQREGMGEERQGKRWRERERKREGEGEGEEKEGVHRRREKGREGVGRERNLGWLEPLLLAAHTWCTWWQLEVPENRPVG